MTVAKGIETDKEGGLADCSNLNKSMEEAYVRQMICY